MLVVYDPTAIGGQIGTYLLAHFSPAVAEAIFGIGLVVVPFGLLVGGLLLVYKVLDKLESRRAAHQH